MRGYPVATAILDLTERTAAHASASEDLCLAEALRQGDERAYEDLITRFQQPVFTLASRLLNDPAEAADVVQEVFLKVFRSHWSFPGPKQPQDLDLPHYGQRGAQRAPLVFPASPARDGTGWPARGQEPPLAGDGGGPGRSPYEEACNQEQHRIIEAALLRLNPLFKEAVVLRDIADLSYEEIAEVLNVSLGTVKSRILRGREALRAGARGQPR
jgi:RNA polymerase sigma-70 factor, ECF subfamily